MRVRQFYSLGDVVHLGIYLFIIGRMTIQLPDTITNGETISTCVLASGIVFLSFLTFATLIGWLEAGQVATRRSIDSDAL